MQIRPSSNQAIDSWLVTAGLVVLLFFLAPPYGLTHLWIWSPIICTGTYVAVAISFVLYFWRVRIDVLGALAIVYWLVLLTSTLLMDTSVVSCIRNYLPCTAAILLARALYDTRKRELLLAVFLVFFGYLLVNIWGMLFVPVGDKVFHKGDFYGLLDNRNLFPRVFLASVGSSALLDYLNGRAISIRTIIAFLACLVQSAISLSTTGMLALVFFGIALFAIQWRQMRKYLNALAYSIGYLVLFFAFVVFRLQGVFGALITEALHKSITFSGRTEVWDRVFELAADPDHFLFGYCGSLDYLIPGPLPIWTGHNAILDVLYTSGAVGVAVALVVFALAALCLYGARYNKEAAIVAAVIGGFLILGLMEHIVCVPFCLFLGLGYGFRMAEEGRSPSDHRLSSRLSSCGAFDEGDRGVTKR